MAHTPKYRNFTITVNNPTEEDVTLLDTVPCKYIVYGNEVGESGTPHKQGTIIFKSQKTLSAAIKSLPRRAHVEVCKHLFKSIEYCKKDGDVIERGEPPKTKEDQGNMEKERWANFISLAEQDRLEEIDPKDRVKHYRAAEYFRSEGAKKRRLEDTEERMEWYYGPSGTGKSRKARSENPAAYLKMCNKWWDGYADEDCVIIEDFDKKHDVLAHHMKIWGDRYDFLAEHKGGAKRIRPKKIIVTSNYHPKDIWTQVSDLEPILRRFKCVHFGSITMKEKEPIANLETQYNNRI
ncbi:MAG: helicase [Cressdnaviricota sp.]|nr:MAG: helicase [Cressdnaviricota sp.]